MRTKLTIKPIYKLTQKEYSEHRRLCFRSDGDIFFKIANFRFDARARVISLRDETGKLISWGLLYPTAGSTSMEPSNFQIYTRKPFRRKGYGRRVYKKAQKYLSCKPFVHSHDVPSTEFFLAMGHTENELDSASVW